jgi:hypothetical protein
VCDTRMVVRVVVITCSEWITHNNVVCSVCLCTHLYCVTSIVISCVRRGKFVWHDPTWGRARYFKYFCANQCYRVESVH